jgi:DNA-binding beta-propeller fold protein YncE
VPEYKLNAVTTDTNVQAPFVGVGAGVLDRAAFVGTFDIGQGSFHAVFNADGRPFLYFDMGGGMGGGLFTYPHPEPVFCFQTVRMIVQSHFDEDHYKTSTLAGFQAALLAAAPLLVIPRQHMGVFDGAAKVNLLGGGIHIHYWPLAGLQMVTLGATGVEIVKCDGNGKNHDGLAIRIEDPGAANEWVLMPADAHYDRNVFDWNVGGQNLDNQVVGIVPTHHGARELTANIPHSLAGGVRVSAYSFGPGNKCNHPFDDPLHADGDGVTKYQGQGYADAGRLQTAGRPLNDPNAGPRGNNLAILLSGATPAATCLGGDPNQAPGHADVISAAIAIAAAAATAAHQIAGVTVHGDRLPVAAAYQAALEHHRRRADDRPVAEYLAQRGLAAAPIVGAAGGGMRAWLATSLHANDSADAAKAAREAEPVARAIAQLVAAAAEACAIRATNVAIIAQAGAGHWQAQIHAARRAVIATTANASATRNDGRDAARLINGPARGVRFAEPSAVVFHPAGGGRLLVADTAGSCIAKLNYGTGATELLAGATRRPGNANGNGIAGRFQKPRGLALDGNRLFVADTGNHTIRTVDVTSGATATWVGAAGAAGSADGGPLARFDGPRGLAWAPAANTLYAVDSGNHTLRAVDATPLVSTLAGTAGATGATDGFGAAARLNDPSAIAVDARGVLFVSDTGNHTIRKVVPAQAVGTFAGLHGDAQSLDGTALEARFHTPSGIAPDGAGGFFVADAGTNCIRRITAAGVVTTVAGQALPGHADAAGALAQFNAPSALYFDAGTSLLWVADTGNNVLRRVEVNNAFTVTTLFGQAGPGAYADGANIAARFDTPRGICASGTGLWVADSGNNVIRHVHLGTGLVTTPIGTAGPAANTDGPGVAARFSGPRAVSPAAGNLLWIADTGNQRVRLVAVDFTVSTPGGQPFNTPVGLAPLAGGITAVLDTHQHAVYRIDAAGALVDRLGDPAQAATLDGSNATARFTGPQAAVLDPVSNNLAIVDAAAHTLRILVIDRPLVVTFAGIAGTAGSANGTGAAASFKDPAGLAFLAGGDLLVADRGNRTIRRMTPARVVTLEAGAVGSAGDLDGAAAAARFRRPAALTVNGTDVYIADEESHMVRLLDAAGNVTTMHDVVVSDVLAANLLLHGDGAPPLAVPLGGAITAGAVALCNAAAQAYVVAMTSSFGRPGSDFGPGNAHVPARQPPEAALHACASVLAIAGMEPELIAAFCAAAALGPAVEVGTTGLVVPGAAADAAEFQRRLTVAAVAALVGARQNGTVAHNARAAVAAARAASAAARGAPLVGCHRHPSNCGANVCSLTIHEFG